jgi:peptidyl-dipeptidase Dcp
MDSWFNKKVKYGAIPFGRFSPTQLYNAFIKDIKTAISQVKELEKNEDEPTFFNTIIELETIHQLAYRYYNMYVAILSVDTAYGWCNINDKMNKTLGNFEKSFLSQVLFEKVETIFKNHNPNLLTDSDLALLTHYRNFYKSHGIGLTKNQKKEFFRIDQKLLQHGLKYSQNLNEIYKSTLKVKSKDQLMGISESMVSIAKKNAQKNSYSGYLLKGTDNNFLEILRHGKNRNIREKIYNLHYNSYQNKYLESNEKIGKDILKLRKRKATLLGYSNYSNLILESNSIKNYRNLSKMTNMISKGVKPKVKHLYNEIEKLAKNKDDVSNLQSWDVDFYLSQYLQSKYSVNEQKLKAFFPLEHVQKELFNIVYKMFGVKFTKTRLPVYNKDVEVFKVSKGETYLGLLYLDVFERTTKESVPFCMPMIESGFNNRRPSVILSSSVVPPTKGSPTLLSLDDVILLFHEMGHALHVFASEIEYSCISGFNVAQDFSEVPSIFLESLVLQPQILQSISCHYKTKKKLGSKWISDLIRLKRTQMLKNTFYSLMYSKIDTEAHRASLTQLKSFSTFEKKLLNKVRIIKPLAGESVLTNFEHIFSSEYQGAYYSYLWSDVIAKDICAQFLKAGNGSFFNKTVCNRFYKEVLAKGGSLDCETLYKNFKGSGISVHPFLRGLKIKA